jgi:uncharacterized protein (TIGR03643 family)
MAEKENFTSMHQSENLMEMDENRIVEMAWEDRTPFEAIEIQFGLPEKEVIKLMRATLKRSSFNLWRKRVNSGVSQKHLKRRNPEIDRFKCTRQRQVSLNKLSKR